MKSFKILAIFLLLFLFNGCLQDPEISITKIETSGFIGYVQDGALVGGKLDDSNNEQANFKIKFGLCYGTNHNPSIDDLQVFSNYSKLDGGMFHCTLVDLEDSTKYFVRAFAKNDYGVIYGEETSFMSLSRPRVNTLKLTEISTNQLVVECELTSVGSGDMNMLGICFSQSNKEPTIEADSCIWIDKLEKGKYSVNLSVNPVSKTYIRAVARNLAGVNYGETLDFTTNDYPDFNEHEFVDLGLSSRTLWATCNIGANSPEEYGDYFAWGETESKAVYNWNTYRWCSGGNTKLTKYCIASSNGVVDNKTILDPEDDAAKVLWGGDWRMPTVEEQEELLVECNWTWTTQNGVKGYKVVSKKNGNSIFIPASGYRYGSSLYDTGSMGTNWSCSLSDPADLAYHIGFVEDKVDIYNDDRCSGITIRPILPVGITYSVSFNSNKGEGMMQSIIVTENSSITIPENQFTRSGYKFVGWNTKSDGTGDSYSVGQTIQLSNNMILYAQWEEETSQEPSGGDSTSHEYVDLGLPSGTLWATCNVGATKPEEYGDYFAWGETTTKSFYPSAFSSSYIVSFKDAANANWGGDWRMPTKAEQDELRNTSYTTWTWTTQNGVNGYKVTSKKNSNSIFLPAAGYRNDSSLSNAGLQGYYWSSSLSTITWHYAYDLDFDSDKVDISNFSDVGGGCSVRPVLRIGNLTFEVTFNPGVHGEGSMETITIDFAEQFSIPENQFETICYDFIGWNTESDGTGTSYEVGKRISISKDMTLYAQWKVKNYTISYNPNGGEGEAFDVSVECGMGGTNKNTFTREGYTFVGWNTKADGTGTSYSDHQELLVENNMTLYAQWEKTFSIFYNPNGGEGEIFDVIVKQGSSIIIAEDIYRECYIFKCWNEKPDGSGVSYNVGQNITIEKDMTLYAQWKLQTYTISYNPNGGNGEGTIYDENVDCGSTVSIKENNFTREGYTFVGWNTESDGTGVIYTESQVIEVMKNMTLYAQWEKTFVLSYNPNGGNGEMSNIISQNGEFIKISTNTFTRDNYYFIGWNTKENGSGTTYKVGQEIQIADDITLYAQWVTYVDLGLPSGTLWATCNVGAYTPEGIGSKFAWGETEPKESYSWSNYKWCYGTYDSLNKYYSNYGYGTFDNKTKLDLEDDAAYVNWGEDWRMPTPEEFLELCSDYCYWTQASENGIAGSKITSKVNGNSIFLPHLTPNSNSGHYWSNTRHYSKSNEASFLYCGETLGFTDSKYRYYASPIRPVLRK